MSKLKFYIFFALIFLITSCSSIKNNNEVLATVIKDLKTPYSLHHIDSVEIVDFQFLINKKLLDGYKKQKVIASNNGLQSSDGSFEWVDKKHEWILNDDEIDFMIKELSKQKKGFWEKKDFIKNQEFIQLVDFSTFYNPFVKDKEIQERIKKEKFVYFFSKPLFNRKKDIFIIQYETLLLLNSRTTLIYKKENGKWKHLAGLYPYG